SGESRGKLEGHTGNLFRLDFSRDGKRLVSGGDDHTALVWDLTHIGRDPKERIVLKPAEVEEAWNALAGTDAVAAFTAMGRLASSPDEALPFMSKQVKAAKSPEKPDLTRLIADLDSDDFDFREKASAALEKVGIGALPELRKA